MLGYSILPHPVHCVRKKSPFYFWNKSVKNKPISVIFGTPTPGEIWH